jgi:hypothetical protein
MKSGSTVEPVPGIFPAFTVETYLSAQIKLVSMGKAA